MTFKRHALRRTSEQPTADVGPHFLTSAVLWYAGDVSGLNQLALTLPKICCNPMNSHCCISEYPACVKVCQDLVARVKYASHNYKCTITALMVFSSITSFTRACFVVRV